MTPRERGGGTKNLFGFVVGRMIISRKREGIIMNFQDREVDIGGRRRRRSISILMRTHLYKAYERRKEKNQKKFIDKRKKNSGSTLPAIERP